MKQTIKSNTDPNWPLIEMDYEKPIELFIDSFMGFDSRRYSFKILYVKEAEAISGFKKQVLEHFDKVDLILAYDEEILQKCPNAIFMPFGTTWIHDYKPVQKSFAVSHLTGHKEITEGHMLRKKVHYKQDKIKIPRDFYISQYGGVENFNANPMLGESKEPLFRAQFHICIENSKQKNYFTEKIVDCFITKTIPIYWGCPNIGDFFDTKGIVVVENFEDIIKACNSLTPNFYESRIEAVENNYKKALEYADLKECLKNKLEKTLLKTCS